VPLHGAEASPGEPGKYVPSGRRTFARVTRLRGPGQGPGRVATQLGFHQDVHHGRRRVDGRDIADSFDVAATRAKLDVVDMQQYEPKATNYIPLAAGVVTTRADCVLIAALTEDHATLITR
jgi:branched-chain amino acid transport system substrate-binding protein